VKNNLINERLGTGDISKAKSTHSVKPHELTASQAHLHFLRHPRHQLTLLDHGYEVGALHGVPVYFSAFAHNHCAYPVRDGQVELM